MLNFDHVLILRVHHICCASQRFYFHCIVRFAYSLVNDEDDVEEEEPEQGPNKNFGTFNLTLVAINQNLMVLQCI